MSALTNRVPTAVLVVEVVGAAVALGALALHLALHLSTIRRGLATTVVAALLVTVLLVVTFDEPAASDAAGLAASPGLCWQLL